MTLYQGYDWTDREIIPTHKIPLVKAALKFASRANTPEAWDVYKCVYRFMSCGAAGAAIETWAQTCQVHQLCHECGGELRLYLERIETGSLPCAALGVDPSDYREVMRCRECGRASDWQQVEVGIADELPI